MVGFAVIHGDRAGFRQRDLVIAPGGAGAAGAAGPVIGNAAGAAVKILPCGRVAPQIIAGPRGNLAQRIVPRDPVQIIDDGRPTRDTAIAELRTFRNSSPSR